MKLRVVFFLLLSLPLIYCSGINREVFYKAFTTGDLSEINSVISTLNNEKQTSLNKAYTGALKMKKASLLTLPIEKLKVFKEGALLLEKEIAENESNSEYRFLRLVIQENAPKILGYNKNIDDDRVVVVKSYENMNSTLRKYVMSFSEQSKVLNPSDLSRK